MNSIVFTPVTAAPVPGTSIPEIALHRLGAWLDAERVTLGRVLAQAGRPQGPAPFDAHLRWSGARLEDILATLRRALMA